MYTRGVAMKMCSRRQASVLLSVSVAKIIPMESGHVKELLRCCHLLILTNMCKITCVTLGSYSMAVRVVCIVQLGGFTLLTNKPPRIMVAESDDGLLFSTVQVYSPPVVTVRVCVYCAVSGSSNTVSVPSVTVVVESLVQVTVVAGPPVEIQVRVSWSESNVTSSPIIVVSPIK